MIMNGTQSEPFMLVKYQIYHRGKRPLQTLQKEKFSFNKMHKERLTLIVSTMDYNKHKNLFLNEDGRSNCYENGILNAVD